MPALSRSRHHPPPAFYQQRLCYAEIATGKTSMRQWINSRVTTLLERELHLRGLVQFAEQLGVAALQLPIANSRPYCL
jgi:hypothetical protein